MQLSRESRYTQKGQIVTNESQTPVLEALTEMSLAPLANLKELDAESVMLVRFAALVALDAPPLSYLVHLAVEGEAGLDQGKVEEVLLVLAPLVGSARIVSAGSKMARAIGLAVLGAEAAAESNDG